MHGISEPGDYPDAQSQTYQGRDGVYHGAESLATGRDTHRVGLSLNAV